MEPAPVARLSERALGRALLARQGLLDRHPSGIAAAVEAVGAIQAQHWPAASVAIWSRMLDATPDALHDALARGDLLVGTLLRGTLHLVSAREQPAYAAVAAGSGANWRRSKSGPSVDGTALRAALVAHAAERPRTADELAEFLERCVADHPDWLGAEEVEAQRKLRWRAFIRWPDLVRVPADDRWTARTPEAYAAAPPAAEDAQAALEEVVTCHLRAFGPASAEDVAQWIGRRVPEVRAALRRMAPGLARFTDEHDRELHDLPGAPRPDPETDAPVRLLAAFDSALLAYAPRHRARILPDEHREAIYRPGNLRIEPTFLVDGRVAGMWTPQVKRREATITLRPLVPVARAQRRALVEEAERLLQAIHPDARGHRAAFAD